jgi:hypothetical protein
MKVFLDKNINLFITLIITLPVTYAGAVLKNSICENFIYFFNFYVSLVLVSYLFFFDSLKENIDAKKIPNQYLYFLTWLIPAFILVFGGWIASGILWFATWAVAYTRLQEAFNFNDK